MILLFSACSPDTDSYEYLFEGGRDALDNLPIEVGTFFIVLPADASANIYDSTVSLAKKIKENTHSDTRIVYDYEELSVKSDDMLILVGKTAYDESQNFLRNFRKDDFGYTYSERIVLICGICEDSILSAIEKFRKDVVLYADSELFISNGKEYIFRPEYEIKRISLNGYQLYDYSIVYPNKNTDAFLAASYFRERLAENTGYYLDIKSDTQIENNARAICIGKTKLDTTVSDSIGRGESLISGYPSGISLISDNLYTTKRALDSLLDTLCATDTSAVSDVNISSAHSIVEFDEAVINDVSPSAVSSSDALKNTANVILDNSSGFVRISDTSAASAISLLSLLSTQYSIYSLNERIHYIYDNTKYNISHQKYEDITEGTLHLVSFSHLFANLSFVVFDTELTASTQRAASSMKEKISSVIDTNNLRHGTVFSDHFYLLDTLMVNTIPNAIKLSEEAYSFGDATYPSSMRSENGITNITLTLYR